MKSASAGPRWSSTAPLPHRIGPGRSCSRRSRRRFMSNYSSGRTPLPQDVRTAAECYLRLGLVPIPVPWRNKAPHVKDWQHLRPTLADLDGLFPPGVALNVGLLLGTPSGGLIDIDLDAPEAVTAAPLLLPATGWVSGRSSKPRSHWWYHVSDPPAKATTKFLDLDDARACLLEVRSTGGQTVVPPSQHPSSEPLSWHT